LPPPLRLAREHAPERTAPSCCHAWRRASGSSRPPSRSLGRRSPEPESGTRRAEPLRPLPPETPACRSSPPLHHSEKRSFLKSTTAGEGFARRSTNQPFRLYPCLRARVEADSPIDFRALFRAWDTKSNSLPTAVISADRLPIF